MIAGVEGAGVGAGADLQPARVVANVAAAITFAIFRSEGIVTCGLCIVIFEVVPSSTDHGFNVTSGFRNKLRLFF